jgi:hypothetical protein
MLDLQGFGKNRKGKFFTIPGAGDRPGFATVRAVPLNRRA